jgi:cell division protein FtsA
VRAGVFLCGGGARVEGIEKLVERIFQLPAHPGRTNNINGLKSALDQPEFATAIGLVKYGSVQQKKRPRVTIGQAIKETFTGLLRRS